MLRYKYITFLVVYKPWIIFYVLFREFNPFIIPFLDSKSFKMLCVDGECFFFRNNDVRRDSCALQLRKSIAMQFCAFLAQFTGVVSPQLPVQLTILQICHFNRFCPSQSIEKSETKIKLWLGTRSLDRVGHQWEQIRTKRYLYH